MKNVLKLIVVTCVVLSGILMIWAKSNNVQPIAESSLINVQSQLYVSNCARCHGADGKGNTQLGQQLSVPDLTTSGMSSKGMTQIIMKGDGEMPAYGKKLKAKQIASIVKYVKRLK
jgi:cytochrome c oxidase cbb3-type subunit III